MTCGHLLSVCGPSSTHLDDERLAALGRGLRVPVRGLARVPRTVGGVALIPPLCCYTAWAVFTYETPLNVKGCFRNVKLLVELMIDDITRCP